MAKGTGIWGSVVSAFGGSAIGMIVFVGGPVSIGEIVEYDDYWFACASVALLIFVYLLVRLLVGEDEADAIAEHVRRRR